MSVVAKGLDMAVAFYLEAHGMYHIACWRLAYYPFSTTWLYLPYEQLSSG